MSLFIRKMFYLPFCLGMVIVNLIFAFLLSIIGIIGAILPGLPGPQLGYVALWIAQFVLGQPFSRWFLIVWGIVQVILVIIDYLLPLRGTRIFGGTKWGKAGCLIGIFVGLFFGPLGVIFGPFIGALVGEYLHQSDVQKALKSAFWSFLGFISGVVLKLIISIVMLGYLIAVCIS